MFDSPHDYSAIIRVEIIANNAGNHTNSETLRLDIYEAKFEQGEY